jgi:hypothetical protein
MSGVLAARQRGINLCILANYSETATLDRRRMSRILRPLLALLASATRQDLARQVVELKEENKVLRERLPKRLEATDKEKRRLMRAGRKLGAQLKELASFVSYQTFARWLLLSPVENGGAFQGKMGALDLGG